MCLFSILSHSFQVRTHAVTIQYHIQRFTFTPHSHLFRKTSSIILNIQCFLRYLSEKHSFTLINRSNEEGGIRDARPIHSRSNVFFFNFMQFFGEKT